MQTIPYPTINIGINNANIISSTSVMLFLIILMLIFLIKWRHDQIPIMQVLTFLILNQTLYSACQVLGYIDQQNAILCTISIIGRMSFSVAANFWIIFITRLVYRQALAPGKYYDLVKFVAKNVIFTYIPSIVLSAFLLVIIYATQTQSEKKCWQIITDTNILDYIVYGTTFVLPNLISSIIIVLYLYWLYRLHSKKWTMFLLFPITDIIFSMYFITIKIYQFYNENQEYLNIFLLAEPIAYGIFYIFIYYKMKKKNNSLLNSADITIRGSEGEGSFVEDL